MTILLYLVIVYACGLITGYALHLYWQQPDDVVPPTDATHHARGDCSHSPANGYAVLVTAAGETISRRKLYQSLATIPRYHGRGQVETFVYTGQNEAGDAVFQVKS